MPAPLDDTLKAAILADLKTGTKSRNRIARDHKVSVSTVTKLARSIGVEFDRSQTENATKALLIDLKAARAKIQSDLIADVQRLRKRAWSKYPVVASGPDGPETVYLPLPPLRDVQAAYTSIGIALDKTMAIDRHDNVTGDDGAVGMLGALSVGLKATYEALTGPPPAEDAGGP